MPMRVTFPIAIAWAWAMVEVPNEDEEADVTEERKLVCTSGADPAAAANTLAEHYSLDPSSQILTAVINIDADDPVSGGVELTIPPNNGTINVTAKAPE